MESKKETIVVRISVPLTKELVHGVFTTAIESSIGYWADVKKYRWSLPGSAGNLNDTDLDGFMATIKEIDTSKRFEINQATILRGIRRAASKAPETFAAIVGENYDANDADTILQLAVFNELVYG